jgi:hypothetical protein
VSSPARFAAMGAVFLGLFALVFSAGSALGVWPPPPDGGFRESDLAAGVAFALVLLVTLLVPRLRRPLG